ncbi:YicC/YloC family endoribonuclease [Marinobacter sp. chi1]|uniref:YicC/YloC family endoribonuclease n=1 Tax=Marinobacter suaedae TaxID=3057675 RepID=A0ABT8W0P0_9GAMM|nr:YicC/YloC family endoribonuclease [Marinobacter sp. chi1]MDO3721766.1 YicC/YloC family endoribonuclease [Marinobacter sp. chi1]
MIRSMTAFARSDTQGEWGTLTCEIRTVNHRYLEPSFRLPDVLRELENSFREALRKHLKRGKVDVTMRLQSAEQVSDSLDVNEDLVRAVGQAAARVSSLLDNPAPIDTLDVLRWPGVLSVAEQDFSEARAAASGLFDQVLAELVKVREREGERLRPLFSERLETITRQVAEVRSLMPELLKAQERVLRDRFEKARVELEPERVAQEMVMLAQKCDVAEELDRLDAHVSEVTDTLASDAAIGRRLDFLMQELNREANTLSSKSIDARVTRTAVDLKVLIEQMREQVQNLE